MDVSWILVAVLSIPWLAGVVVSVALAWSLRRDEPEPEVFMPDVVPLSWIVSHYLTHEPYDWERDDAG